MTVTVIDHPLVADRLATLRAKSTGRADFRRALHEISLLLVYEALRDQPVTAIDLDTPMAPASGRRLTELPVVVPVVRAGLGMLDAALTLLPDARVAFVGAKRNEATFEADVYLNTVPDELDGRRAVVLDPMLATGGSLVQTCGLLADAGCVHLTVVTVLAAPEGIAAFEANGFDATVITGAIDRNLDANAFIVPGLGDAGDRQFGLA
ncbi:MAG: uracil phosphoribosyltransferase [Acidimicrobiales bacterium]|nr:uracil phosphoribosyltransferase [Acidimicrobiales bacterium]